MRALIGLILIAVSGCETVRIPPSSDVKNLTVINNVSLWKSQSGTCGSKLSPETSLDVTADVHP